MEENEQDEAESINQIKVSSQTEKKIVFLKRELKQLMLLHLYIFFLFFFFSIFLQLATLFA